MAYATPQNISGIVDMFQYANAVTNDYFVIMLLVSLYIIPLIFLMVRGFDWQKAGIAAGFILVMAASVLRIAEIYKEDTWLLFAIAAFIIPMISAYLTDRVT